jgi:predicted nucleic acid-binding protein
LTAPLPNGTYHGSIIIEIELFSYLQLTSTEEQKILNFLSQLLIIGIDESIKTRAIALRKQYCLKLSDALVSAIVQSFDALLLTRSRALHEPLQTPQPKSISALSGSYLRGL